jgi:hypothetical protein
MKDSKINSISTFKSEKNFQIFIAVYLSIILLSIILILVKIEMTGELQQALVVVLGLVSVTTLDAFKKALDSKNFPLESIGNKIIIREGGVYVGGDYIGGNINHEAENRQTLAEAATEIHKLLQELERLNPNATETEKITYVNEEVASEFKSRVVDVAKETGESEAAIEIQLLLQRIEKNLEEERNPARATLPTKDSVLESAVMMIESGDISLKSRMINALKLGGDAAIEELLSNNPYSKVTQAIIKGWLSQENK